ncbi:MAG: hypothetical protein HOP30_22735 [Cyclobacteriaceae bacterium]|nr:hypothetical protein [Cyclobacteriaceae bacterium]
MKTNKFILFWICLLVGFSCQDESVQQPISEFKNIIDQFTTVIKSNNEAYASQINELEKAIDFRSIKKYDLRTTEKLLIANLTKLNKFAHADQLRAIFFINNNQIVRSQIVVLENEGNFDANQLITNTLDMKPLTGYTGKISFYSIFQMIQLASTFNNGRLTENSAARKIASVANKAGKTNTCIDWYLITTYHYEGGATQTVEVYLFTSCDEPCGLAGARTNCGGGGGGGSNPSSTQFPPNPLDGDIYETTDAAGFYTKYVYDATRMIWVGVERILPGFVLQENPSAYPFLQSIRWPVDGQKVTGPDNMVYMYNGSSGSWVGELIDFYLTNLSGNKPISEFEDKCIGLQSIWDNYPNNEVYGFITTDGKLLVTNVLPINGGSASGPYTYNGTTYYPYPSSQGPPIGNYTGMIQTAGYYLIPIVASVHTHTPCRTDGTNGVSHNIGDDDANFAASHPSINHWVIGCNAIAQYDNRSSNFFNLKSGKISSNCGVVK